MNKISYAKAKQNLQTIFNKNQKCHCAVGPAITLYTYEQFYTSLNESISTFVNKSEADLLKDENFVLYKEVCADLKKLPNFIGDVHRGTGFDYKFEEGRAYCVKRFFSTSKKPAKA